MSIWIATAVALLLAGLAFAVRTTKKRKALATLTEREALTDDEIFQRFYASSSLEKGEVVELWREVAQTLGVPAERLRPTDRFGKDIGMHWITSEELDALGVLAQQRANRRGLTIDLSAIQTVDDYVKRLSA